MVQRLLVLSISKAYALNIVVRSIVVVVVPLLGNLLVKATERPLRKGLSLGQFFIFYLLNFRYSLRPVSVELLLKN